MTFGSIRFTGPKVKGVPRDASRVTGSDGSAYYTTDHYDSFITFRSGG